MDWKSWDLPQMTTGAQDIFNDKAWFIKHNFQKWFEYCRSWCQCCFHHNGQTIDVGKTYANATLSDVMNAINSSSAGSK